MKEKLRTYHLKVIITESSDEFWEDIKKRKVTGTDEVVKAVKNALADYGWNADYEFGGTTVELEKFELI